MITTIDHGFSTCATPESGVAQVFLCQIRFWFVTIFSSPLLDFYKTPCYNGVNFIYSPGGIRNEVYIMLAVSHLTKRYSSALANADISFVVQPGEVSVLLGPNGAGKSTAVKCIVGLLRFEGEITVCGHPNKSLEAKRVLGYVPEMPALYELLTVEEHLEFIARAYELKDWKPWAQTLMDRFELTDKKDKLGSELSKGMQQKVSICAALLPVPKVILFDEPMVGLDPHAIKELKKLFLELKQGGCSVIISTHMLDSVDELWDSAHIMMGGRIAASRTREEIERQNESLEDLFFQITEGGSK